jgi:uncharacterized protein (DUF924 family)
MIVDFWLAAGREAWFAKSDAFDAQLRAKFEVQHHEAARGEHDDGLNTAHGALALVLLLDQVPRNIYRHSGHAFATDPLAKRIAGDAIAKGFDRAVEPALRNFFYLPFEHSEAMEDQDRSVALCQTAADEIDNQDSLKWAKLHRDIIIRFGRFPHRNAALGRTSTAEELAFLAEGGFSG